MKEFTQSITLHTPTKTYTTLQNPTTTLQNPTLSSIFPLRLLSSPFTFDPERIDGDGGPTYRCDMDFIVDRPSNSAMSQLSHPRECIVELSDSEGNSYQIGSLTMPARVSITPHLQRARLHVACTMLFSPLLFPM